MNSEKRETLVRLALTLMGIIVMLVASAIRKYSARDLGITWPVANRIWVWPALFVAVAVLQEWLSPAFGIPPPQRWGPAYTLPVKVIRVFTMVVLAPISEELLLRGLLYHVLLEKGLKDSGAILITSMAFSLLHIQSGAGTVLWALVDGLFYGAVRCFTGSIVLPVSFHAIGNTYAAYQRFRRL
jgi:membrane protease YdiL (CAAX protease family)